ncbi:MAG: hypothetical protein NTV87_16910 [Ignavibacteriae bacterium]|jgi:hypothetical protein|nr:hypothetical protein [Ignavibacteriota bacterium]
MKKSIFKNKFRFLISAIIISAAGFYGCNNDSSTVTSPSDNLNFSVMSSADSVGDAQNILILDTVKILIKDIKLDVASEDSANFKVGPFVLFLNLSSSINPISSSVIPYGVYKKVKFEVHKLNDNEAIPDPEFADINGRYSVIIKGWYLGNYFIYKSTKSAHQKLSFPVDLPITMDYYQNITLVVRPYIWFIKNGAYLDPRVSSNSNDIDNNIKDNINHNFKAFRDNDRNGIPD